MGAIFYSPLYGLLEEFPHVASGNAGFSNQDDFAWGEVIQLMEREPHLAELNAGVAQKALQGA